MTTETAATELARLQRAADQHLADARLLDAADERPSDLAIIQCVADQFDVEFHVASDWVVSVGVECAA